MARVHVAHVALAFAWAAVSGAALTSLVAATLRDRDSGRSESQALTPAHVSNEARPDLDDAPVADASTVPDLIDLEGLLDFDEAPEELPPDLFLADDDASDAAEASDSQACASPLIDNASAPPELHMPPLLTQEVPLAHTVDRGGLAALLTPSTRCMLAGLSIVRGASMPAELTLAITRAALELTGAPTSPATLLATCRADIEQLGTLEFAHAPVPGRIALSPTARAAGAELLAALPGLAVEHLGDAALRWWIEFTLTADIAGEEAGVSGALVWARQHDRHRALLELVQALATQPPDNSLEVDKRTCLEWARDAAATMADGEAHLWAAHLLTSVLVASGESEQARAQLDDALALSTQLGRHLERRAELHALAQLDAREGDADSAWTRHQEALLLAQHSQDTSAQREELHSLAVLDAQGGRVADARAGFEVALDLARATGDVAAERAERHALAVLAAREGRLEEARTGYFAALELARQLGDRRIERSELHELAALDARAGNVDDARAGFEAALALARELGDTAAESTELQALGFRDLNMGRLSQARVELHAALALAIQAEQPLLLARALWSCAELDARLGLVDDACARFQEALALYERLGDPDAHNAYIRLRLRELGLAH